MSDVMLKQILNSYEQWISSEHVSSLSPHINARTHTDGSRLKRVIVSQAVRTALTVRCRCCINKPA